MVVATFSDMIRARALELGFSSVGIARAEPLAEERSRLEAWLAQGYHGAMAWMERDPEKRTDPAQLLPGARSVVVGTFNYFTPFKHDRRPESGKISRYAWGDDYHDVVREKLAALLEWIKSERPEVQGKVCVDTAPMMDKAWAARAGLGWLGKHTNLITPDNGSWVFIGEIIVDIELEYDAPAADHCGSCTACIEACPTGAIVEPFVVDSNRCISYATIELKDEQLPGEVAAKLDGWIYGCDICQEVCPWNRFENPSTEPRFAPRHGETELALDAVEDFTPDAYAERFRNSAMKRAKLAGLKRNAAALRSGSAKTADRR